MGKKPAVSKQLMTRYPWNEWFSEDHFTLRKGDDFDCEVHSMGVQIRNAAYKRKFKVSVHLNATDGLIEVFVRQRGNKKTQYA